MGRGLQSDAETHHMVERGFLDTMQHGVHVATPFVVPVISSSRSSCTLLCPMCCARMSSGTGCLPRVRTGCEYWRQASSSCELGRAEAPLRLGLRQGCLSSCCSIGICIHCRTHAAAADICMLCQRLCKPSGCADLAIARWRLCTSQCCQGAAQPLCQPPEHHAGRECLTD